MKAYTNLEQSKKLAEILPIESADMCYRIVAYNPNDTHEYQPYCFKGTLSSDIPCWSLSALLDIISYPTLSQEFNGKWSCMEFLGGEEVEGYETPVDACVEIIIELHEQKIL